MSADHDAAAKDALNYDELKPVLPGPAGSDYENYLRTDELLSLQKTPEEMVHRDERLFQTVHQSSELWLKLACFEIDEAIALIGEDEIRRALRLLGRANHCIVIVSEALHMLERLSPWEYHELRKALGHGSGFDSPGWKRLRRLAHPLWTRSRRCSRAAVSSSATSTRASPSTPLFTISRRR
jgi:tryptophan 2,3-dioxygenase